MGTALPRVDAFYRSIPNTSRWEWVVFIEDTILARGESFTQVLAKVQMERAFNEQCKAHREAGYDPKWRGSRLGTSPGGTPDRPSSSGAKGSRRRSPVGEILPFDRDLRET